MLLKQDLFNLHYQLKHSYLCSLCGRSLCSNQLGLVLHYEEEYDRFLRAWCLLEHLLHQDHEGHYNQQDNSLQCVHLYLLSPNSFSDLSLDKKVFLVPMVLLHLLMVLVPFYWVKQDPYNLHYQPEHNFLSSLCGRIQCSNQLGSTLRYEEEYDHYLRVWCLLEHQQLKDHELHYNQLCYSLQCAHLYLLSPSS